MAARLGSTPAGVSYLRDRLIRKGTIFPSGRQLAFPIPGLADWLIAHADELSEPGV